MKRLLIISAMVLMALHVYAQDANQKIRGPIWITDDKNTDVIGVSLSAYPKGLFQGKETPMSRTFGVKLEVFALSPFYFLAPKTPLSRSEKAYKNIFNTPVNEKIYGFNLETGSFSSKDVYGFSATAFVHYSRKNNGISISGISNNIERGNGIMVSSGGNGVYKGNGIMIGGIFGNGANYFNGIQISTENYINAGGAGIQIGLFNKATHYRGVQIGIWNKNDKRSLPFINWQFSD